jgi:4'-phosphopantetheinyl transferase EntD
MLAALLPPGAAFAELAISGPEPAIYPGEELAVARAVAKRRREFAFGRACARRALGLDVAIAVGQGGAPMWPEGYAGSITHTDDHAAAAVVRSGLIGIDVESLAHAAQIPELLATVAITEGERAMPAALVFSAKESVYKCLYPTARKFLEFRDVELVFERDAFRVVRADGYDARGVRGRFALSTTHVATVAIAGISASPSRAPSPSSP